MGNQLDDLKEMAKQQAKQQIKNMAKEAAKKAWEEIMAYIAPVLPYIILGLIIFIIIIGCIDWGAIEASASSQNMQSASSSSWEQFLKYVAIKEGGSKSSDGLYYIVENDSAGNPTVGHGLCLKSQDGYLNVEAFASYKIDSKDLADRWLAGERDLTVSVEICDAIFEEAVKTRYDSIVSQYPELTAYQHYALTDVKYRRGNTSSFEEQYNSKWSSDDNKYRQYKEDEEEFIEGTLYDFFWDNGHPSDGVNVRKKDQWILFKYGYYRPLGEYFIENISMGAADISSLDSNDYGGTYVSSNGFTFIQYYQNGSSWSSDDLNGASYTNLGRAGCNVTSNAIVLSALTGATITPRQVNNSFNFLKNDASSIINNENFSKYANIIGISDAYKNAKSVDLLISSLQEGKLVILKFATLLYGRRNGKGLDW